MKSSWMWGLFVQAQLPFIVIGFSVIVNNYFVVGKKTFPNECVRTMCVAKNMLHVIIIKSLLIIKKTCFWKRKKKEERNWDSYPHFQVIALQSGSNFKSLSCEWWNLHHKVISFTYGEPFKTIVEKILDSSIS